MNKNHEKFFKDLMKLCEKHSCEILSPDEECFYVSFYEVDETYSVESIQADITSLNINKSIQIDAD